MTWTVTPSEGKDPDISDSRQTFIVLMFLLLLQFILDFYFLFYFSFSFPSSVVVVNLTSL